jgi:hypothetical protein
MIAHRARRSLESMPVLVALQPQRHQTMPVDGVSDWQRHASKDRSGSKRPWFHYSPLARLRKKNQRRARKKTQCI